MILLVIGTDTEVGKTFVGIRLARCMVAAGLRVVAIKPVESGCSEASPNGEDGVGLANATGQHQPRAALMRLCAPLAPPVAADRQGAELPWATWIRTIRAAAADNDVVLVEGAGGLMSPLTWDHTALDLAVELGAHALLVARDKLGVLNHALSAVRLLRSAAVPLLGVVFNAEAPDASTETNAPTFARFSGVERTVTCQQETGPGQEQEVWKEIVAWVFQDLRAVDPGPWEKLTQRGLRHITKRGLLRKTKALVLSPGASLDGVRHALAERPDHKVVLFSSNDYLGLSSHPRVVHRTMEATQRFGLGPRGSPLVCGYTHLHEELESKLANLCRTQAALLFPTGYAANTATLTALVGLGGLSRGGRSCDIYSDALNHASIIDGCRLAQRYGARVHVYRHRDMDHLEALLQAGKAAHRLIVTDGVFSMDGTLAPLTALGDLKRRYGALLACDEAHATLVYDRLDGADEVDVHIGTLSKAVGAMGGFAAVTREMREVILNAGRPLVFSTALPMPLVAAALASLELVAEEPGIRESLWARVRQLGEGLGKTLSAPIAPIILGDDQRAMRISSELLELGYHVPGIRPPTVPPGTARLRIALSAAHTQDDVAGLLHALASRA